LLLGDLDASVVDLAASLGGVGGVLDVTDQASYEAWLALVPSVDVLVNNAGVMWVGAFDAEPLREIARRTGGSYAEARSAAELASIYEKLGQQLAGEYLVRYRSLARPTAHVEVNVKVAGAGTAVTVYVAPTPSLLAPYHRSLASRFVLSSGSTVLIVDDERTLARAVKAFLAEAGYEAEVAGDAEQAIELLPKLRPDVVFADVRLPGMSGIDLLRRIREFDPAIAVIIMTAYGTIEGAVEAVKLGASIVHGPHVFNFTDVYEALDSAGGAKRADTQEALVKQLGKLLADPAARNLSVAAAERVVSQLGGALERTLAALEPYLLQLRLEMGASDA